MSALAALIVYAVTLFGTFVYDDFSIFQTDARLHDVARWKEFWTDSYNGGIDNLYRPLVSMSYAFQWWIGGDTIGWPYHVINWLLHAAVCATLAEFVRRLLLFPRPVFGERAGGRGFDVVSNNEAASAKPLTPALSQSNRRGSSAIALLVGVLFAVHPVHVEAVANIVGRAELMCALGFFGAMTLFLHRPLTIKRALAIFGCFVFSLLSKEQGMLLPFMLLVLGFAIRWRATDGRERRAMLALVLIIAWCYAGYIAFREHAFDHRLKFWWDRNFLDWTINPLVRSTGVNRILVPVSILGRYTALLVCPLHLSPDYGANVIGWIARWNEPWIYIGFAAALTWLAACALALVKRSAPMIVALVGLGLTYGLVSNFVSLIGTNFGERLMYLPSAFFLIFLALSIVRLPRRAVIVIASVAILAGALQTFSYARRWNDRLTFYSWAAQQQPQAIRLRMLLISELKAQGRLDEAAAEADRARAILPEYDEIWMHSADVAIDRGRFDEAEQFAEHAMKLRPSMKAESWMKKVERRRAESSTQPTSKPATTRGAEI